MTFPLPRAPQEFYTKFYLKEIQKGALTNTTIVWVGRPLPCRFKSETAKNHIAPQYVFILKSKTGAFEYALVDNRNNTFRLPKKYYPHCFPNVGLASVPESNRVEIQITKRKKQTLPFIPDSFLEQKRSKVNRKKRKMYVESPPAQVTETIDFDVTNVPTWHVLENRQNRGSMMKKQVLNLIRTLIAVTDDSAFHLTDPFASVKGLNELKDDAEQLQKLKTVVGFVYYYCRSELGLAFPNRAYPKNVAEFAEALSA